jgi:hypothetical protein
MFSSMLWKRFFRLLLAYEAFGTLAVLLLYGLTGVPQLGVDVTQRLRENPVWDLRLRCDTGF